MDQQFCTVEEALEELRAGHLILSIDDEDRENEGDLICAAQFATTENVNFMAMHAKGLICTPMSEEIAARLVFELLDRGGETVTADFSYNRTKEDQLFPVLNLLLDLILINSLFNLLKLRAVPYSHTNH